MPRSEGVERRLIAMGAEFRGELVQMDIYLSHPCRDFALTDEALRIRVTGGEWELTYKGSKIDPETKTREEITCPIQGGDDLMALLTMLGFREAGKVRKGRRRFELGQLEISIDRVEGLGDFVELEARVEGLTKGKEMIAETMEALGLRGSERRSYLEMLLEGQE